MAIDSPGKQSDHAEDLLDADALLPGLAGGAGSRIGASCCADGAQSTERSAQCS